MSEAKKFATKDDWFVYLDADERVEYDWSKLYKLSHDVIGIKMRLYDFYITPEDVNDKYYTRKYIGPEFRDILIAFRNLPTLEYKYLDQREVILGAEGKVLNEGYVKHYGKAISVEEWEKTCDYYSNHFPMYAEKWKKRKGKAVHNGYSDFGNELIKWGEKGEKGIDLYKLEEQRKLKNQNKNLKILVTNHHLLDFRGSELFTLNLAQYLTSQGHNVVVYTKYIEDFRQVFERIGVQVVTDLMAIKDEQFDVAHVHHNILALDVRYYFPKLPIIFLSHGIIPFLEQPPVLDIGISKYLAVSEEVKENLITKGIDSSRIEIFRNKIDPNDFVEVKPINDFPTNALVISNKIDVHTEEVIREACFRLNINLEFIGKRFQNISPKQVAKKINWADIVFTLGRGVIETMMCGRIPIVFDTNGGDGIVTPHNILHLMKKNFSGRTYNKKFTVDELVNEIAKYEFKNGKLLKDLSYELFHINSYKQIIAIYNSVILEKLDNYCNDKAYEILEQIISSNKEMSHYQNIISLKELTNSRLEHAEYLIEIGDLIKAQEILKNIHDESNLDVQNNLAVIAIIEEKFPDALEIIHNILQKNPNDEIALSNLHYLQNILKDKKEELVTHLDSNAIIPKSEY